ncbi:hypothetical protein [Sulfuriroseicoccus oceanibius]|uniref:Glycosyltransferase RgtA/B/C/D-like domain-containing protein n=1 Tax=Sulfuriroseicoccus oceanibius TaxID=2707525 RepID=A0A7T7F2J7_9BACT|nr:hypothetical protein [Sulfuriroseicoccus oceanibius]QQL45630.1 hypothetical protein G3M56_003305 [Sulfuriroseicoccus oceanibius]
MRESDQASLVDGGLQIARDGDWLGESYYNYSRQYVSYWVVALGLLPQLDAGIDALVESGNRSAAAVLAFGLAVMASRRRRWSPVELIVLGLALFCPVWWFSAPLLASNGIAAGFVLLLAVVLATRRSGGRSAAAAVLTFLAVGARSDVALILPMIVLLAAPVARVPRLMRDGTTWAMAGSAVLALVVGRLITESPTGMPSTFFDVRLFGAYVVFGLNGLTLAWAVFFLLVVGRAWCGRSLWWAGVAVAVLLPWLFYAPLLYSPRHLVVVVAGVLTTLVLPRGRNVWSQVARVWWARWGVACGVAASLMLSLVGLRMNSMKDIAPVVGESTWYPTADGLWPMGANIPFFVRLAQADERPLDHNQLVWNAWRQVEQVPADGPVAVFSSGLTTYGELRLRALGVDAARADELTEGVVFDSRSFLRRKVDRNQMTGATVAPHEKIGADQLAAMSLVGCSFGAEVYWWGAENGGASKALEVRQLLASLTTNDRMTLGRAGDAWQELAHAGRFEWVVMVPGWYGHLEVHGARRLRWRGGDWSVIQAEGEAGWIDGLRHNLPEDAWVARSTMVVAFQLQ